MATYYIKKIENTSEATDVNSKTNSVNGSILKTSSQVGIFNKTGNNFYSNGQLNTSQGTVFNQSGTNFMPTKSNITNLISNSTVKNIFNKFFNGNDPGTDSNFTNWQSKTSNLNAFAYMEANGVTPTRTSTTYKFTTY